MSSGLKPAPQVQPAGCPRPLWLLNVRSCPGKLIEMVWGSVCGDKCVCCVSPCPPLVLGRWRNFSPSHALFPRSCSSLPFPFCPWERACCRLAIFAYSCVHLLPPCLFSPCTSVSVSLHPSSVYSCVLQFLQDPSSEVWKGTIRVPNSIGLRTIDASMQAPPRGSWPASNPAPEPNPSPFAGAAQAPLLASDVHTRSTVMAHISGSAVTPQPSSSMEITSQLAGEPHIRSRVTVGQVNLAGQIGQKSKS